MIKQNYSRVRFRRSDSSHLVKAVKQSFHHVAALFALVLLANSVAAQSYVVNYWGLNVSPKDIAYYPAKKRFIVNSSKSGELGYINSNGEYLPLLKDSFLIGSSGLKVSDNTLILLSVNRNMPDDLPARSSLVKVNLLNNTLASTTKLDQLTMQGQARDLAIDKDGIIYILTDKHPFLYKLNTAGSLSVIETGGVLNKIGKATAIVYHDNGYLLIAIGGEIYKINLLGDNAATLVSTEQSFQDISSLKFSPNHLLILSEGGYVNKVRILNSSNSWASAKLLRTDQFSYSGAGRTEFVNNKIYVLDSKTSADGGDKPEFSVRVIDLKKRSVDKRKDRKGVVTIEPGKVVKPGF